MAGAMRVERDDLEVARVKRPVVVAAVPHDHVGLLLGLAKDRLVVDSRHHDGAHIDEVFVLLALLDRDAQPVEIFDTRVALDSHGGQVAVGHGVPDVDCSNASLAQSLEDASRDARLAHSCSDRANADDRLDRANHARCGADDTEVSPGCENQRSLVHQIGVRDVAVGEQDLVDRVVGDETGKLGLGSDGDALGVAGPGRGSRATDGRRSRESGLR